MISYCSFTKRTPKFSIILLPCFPLEPYLLYIIRSRLRGGFPLIPNLICRWSSKLCKAHLLGRDIISFPGLPCFKSANVPNDRQIRDPLPSDKLQPDKRLLMTPVRTRDHRESTEK